jgi:hypothetical protein
VTELNREAVLAWLAGLSDGRWLELMVTACQQRGGDPAGHGTYAVAHIWRYPDDEPWSVELVAPEDRRHYEGWSAEDCLVIRAANCPGCGTRVGSGALHAACPVCGGAVECH